MTYMWHLWQPTTTILDDDVAAASVLLRKSACSDNTLDDDAANKDLAGVSNETTPLSGLEYFLYITFSLWVAAADW